MTFKLIAELESAKVEFFNEELRQHAARVLGEMADAARAVNGEGNTQSAKRRGRPPGSKNAATSPEPVTDEPGVDPAALANGEP